ncbi:MAG: OmpA family protein [Cytophagales bacterium]|nr:OmpA family protein [Cytophagales bacterium]MDW8384340.1 OmpA family protein [Flammeovirgaceae bacterium]
MSRLLLCVFLGIWKSVLPCFSQNTSITTKSSKAEKYFLEAREQVKNRDWQRALQLFDKALEADEQFAEAWLEKGVLLIRMMELEKGKDAIRRCVQLQPNHPKFKDAYISVAQFDLSEGNYENAEKMADLYLKYSENVVGTETYRAEAKKIKATCAYARQLMANPVVFQPVKLGKPLNEFDMQYFPVLTADNQTMIFTGMMRNGDENIYQTNWKDNQWSEPIYLKTINTHLNEGTTSISSDGKYMVFTFCVGMPERRVLGRCDLFLSRKVGDVWEKPVNIGAPVNTRYTETQASLSSDGNTMYFVSDRPGGFGGTDIWKTTKNELGQWTTPVNLGNVINTPGDEVSPFIHANGTSLYFSSDGHLGMGGMDLFVSEWKDGAWQPPKNLGYPINKHNNQVGLFITADGSKGYFSDEEMRGNQLYSSILYSFDIPKEAAPSKKVNYVKGVVRDAQNGKKLEARLELLDLKEKKQVAVVQSDSVNGSYLIALPQGSEYALYISKKGYLFRSLTFDCSESSDNVEINIDLEPTLKGSKTVLNNLFFESGKYQLMEKSIPEIEKIAKFLHENPSITIEIGGHTDDVGSDAANLELSLKRAQAVAERLYSLGIQKERIKALGYGETQPLYPNTSDENRAKNRRIEFRIL